MPLHHTPLLLGALLGISLAAPPGPILALMATESTRAWIRGFLTGIAAMTADAVFFLLMWQGVLRVLEDDRVFALLSLAGGVLMLYFAWGAWRHRDAAVVRADPMDAGGKAGGTTFLGAFAIALTNPFQITWWATFGLALLADLGPAVILGFFGGITLFVAFFAALVRWGTERWRALPRAVAVASAVLLAGFALYAWWRAAVLGGVV